MLRARLLVSLFALLALSSAISLNDIHIDGIEEYLHHGEKRQATGTGASTPAPPPPSSTPRPPTSTPPSTPDPTPTDDPTSNPPTSNPPASTPTSPTSGNPPPSSNPPTSRGQNTPTPVTSDVVSTSRSQYTTTITRTNSDGQETLATETGETDVPVTNRIVSTPPPTNQDSSSSGSGLSSNEKSIIGGVVGGVGGALLLGGIGLVFWRMKKRQNRVTEDDDDLMAGTGAALGDKPHNNNGTSPFQSNLEQYHNPGGRPNAAANF